MMSEHDLTFDAMGSHVRLLIGEPGPGMEPAEAAAARGRRFVEDFDATLSRFRPESELCRLNADPRERVPVSELLRSAIEAGIYAAGRSDGLVDPTLVGEIEQAGYVASRAGMTGLPLRDALAEAPERRPAQPRPDSRWREFAVDDPAGEVRPPAGPALRHRRHRQGPGCRPGGGEPARLLPLHRRLRRRHSHRRRRRSRPPLRGLRRAPDQRRARPRAAARLRRRRHLRAERAQLARRGRSRRPPPARPGDRRAGLDRPGRRHCARRYRPGGGDDLQGGAALRA